MKKKSLFTVVGIFVAIIIFFISKVNGGNSEESEVLAKVVKGVFRSEVTASGELSAKNSVNILGPKSMQQAGVWETTISDIIAEGTVVEKGDYVGRLDDSQLGQSIQQKMNDLTISSSKYEEAKLDTAMDLRTARYELDNQLYQMEKQKLVLDNSEFEPPAVIKEKKMELDRAEQKYQQTLENYRLKQQKAVAKIRAAEAEMNEDKMRLEFLQQVAAEFVITAPEPGMLIYKRDWRGNKIAQGGRVAAWDPTVATLPDLKTMISKTYINEVDINTVSSGQEVEIGLDAFPEKKLTGKVLNVANMGQQRPNSDSKVFEVTVEIFESDTTLRPGMSTSNKIIARVIKDAIYVPVEAIHSQGDSITYVIVKNGINMSKKEVLLGLSNSDEVIIEKGLLEGQSVYLSDPSGLESVDVDLLDKSEALAKNDQ